MRVIVPIATGALVVVMFLPPLFFVNIGGWRVAAGIACFAVSLVLLARSAVRSPWAMTVGERLTVRRLFRESTHELADVKKWWFAIPDGKPTQTPPTTNGVLYVVLDDGTRFRAEVTSADAATIAARLASRDTPL